MNTEANEETIELVRRAGHEMTASAPVDLGDSVQERRWVEEAAAEHGRLDVLYNNASADELDLVFYTTEYAWPMLARSGGVVINVGSTAGLVGARHTAKAALSATKGAVIAMTRRLAAEGAEQGSGRSASALAQSRLRAPRASSPIPRCARRCWRRS